MRPICDKSLDSLFNFDFTMGKLGERQSLLHIFICIQRVRYKFIDSEIECGLMSYIYRFIPQCKSDSFIYNVRFMNIALNNFELYI